MNGSTTLFIANLICVANAPTPDLITYHLEQNLTASYFRCWSISLTERKLPMQYTISVEVTPKKHENQVCILFRLKADQWHTVVFTYVASLDSCDLYLFILVTRRKQLDFANQSKRISILLPKTFWKTMGKTFTGVMKFFLLLTSVH